ncbi:MAG: PocR ligand-binding domain-containing protein [Deltaproteobacteria bacterium]|jgi:ligand-binding sensor protein|nr:PocR ligand-binding domain-containing protein [Deltaproteobacteria bacterium]
MSKPLREKSANSTTRPSQSIEQNPQDGDAINNFNILDLFGKERLEAIQRALAQATGLALVTLDYKGDPITEMTGFSPFCLDARQNTDSCALCRSSDVYGAGQALAKQRKFIYFCPHGLLEAAIPIIVRNHFLGAFYGGQIRCADAPDGIPRLARLFEDDLKRCPYGEKQKKLFRNIPQLGYAQFMHITELISLIIEEVGETGSLSGGQNRNCGVELVRAKQHIQMLESNLEHARHENVNLSARLNQYSLLGSLTAIANLAELENAPQTGEASRLLAEQIRYAAPKEKPFVLLSEEMADIRRYLKIQKIRFAERLYYTLDIPKELNSRKIPVHTILPLVEYAVFYGLRADEAELNVSVTASMDGERLLVSVNDDGPGLGEDELAALFARFKGAHEGEAIQMNLHSARRRLRELYGADGGISISATTGLGTQSLVVLPETNLIGGL